MRFSKPSAVTRHPIYGPRLVHVKRHHYKPAEPDPERDPVHSFTIKDDDFAEHIDQQLFAAQVEDKNFTYKHFQTKNGHIFKVEMHGKADDKLKKILFMVGLKLPGGITTR